MNAKKELKYGRTLIYSGQDEYSSVEVVEGDGVRSLHFGSDARQSEMSLTNPFELTLEYTQHMALSLLFHPTPKSVLFLGLGGGSLQKFVWQHFSGCHLDIVERSQVVIDLCYRYFALPQSPRLHIHVDDVYHYIQTSESKYDLIFLDLAGIPDVETKEDFFALIKKCFKNENSLLIWSTWQTTPPEVALKCLHKLLENFGKNILILPGKIIPNDIYLVFDQGMKQPTLFELTQRARELENKTHLQFLQMLADLDFFQDLGFVSQDF